MALNAPGLQSDIHDVVLASLKQLLTPLRITAGGTDPDNKIDDMLEKIATAVSQCAFPIVKHIEAEAIVVPGQQVIGQDSLGEAVTGQTVTPGKVL